MSQEMGENERHPMRLREQGHIIQALKAIVGESQFYGHCESVEGLYAGKKLDQLCVLR